MKPATFFLGGMLCSFSWAYAVGDDPVAFPEPAIPVRVSSYRSDFCDLVERQLDRGLPAEDGHQHLELLGVGVDLGDGGRQRLERPLHDGDPLADLEVDVGGRRRLAGL